jgi:hypothetical protein
MITQDPIRRQYAGMPQYRGDSTTESSDRNPRSTPEGYPYYGMPLGAMYKLGKPGNDGPKGVK